MDIRYSCNQNDFRRYDTQQIREEFLIDNLFADDELTMVYSHVDRMVTMGCMPTARSISLEDVDAWACFGTKTFLERRELGVFNVGGSGKINVDGQIYPLNFKDCLYITQGTIQVEFSSVDERNSAKFYMVSAPAHRSHETRLLTIADAVKRPLGTSEASNRRVINQFIHPDVLPTCQLTMGMTELEPGNVWNTMPAHTHERRMEIYFYFEITGDNVVFHMMGEPSETRHVVMQNEQAIISPSWSIHAGAGTSAYTFIWAMGGENLAFDDMDVISTKALK